MASGEPYVTTSGTTWMLRLFADSLDLGEFRCSHLMQYITHYVSGPVRTAAICGFITAFWKES